jgi:hypothetical protein
MGRRVNKKHLFLGFSGILIFLLIPLKNGFSQIIEAGFKGGLNAAWVRYDDASFRKTVRTLPILGYSFGPVLSFKVKDRYFLHTEYLFSTKGRKNVGKEDEALKDKVTYHFIEIPILYNVFFKGQFKFKGDKQFKYYAGAGPIFSYWLGGRGSIYNNEFAESGEKLPAQKYKIVFGSRDENYQFPDEVFIEDPRRLQVGFAIGGGILTEPDAKQRIMVDVRFEYGHSWLARSETEDFYFPVRYSSNEWTDPSLKARNMSVRLSGIYLFEMNSNKKVRNKGKSTIKKKLNKKR